MIQIFPFQDNPRIVMAQVSVELPDRRVLRCTRYIGIDEIQIYGAWLGLHLVIRGLRQHITQPTPQE